MLRKAVRYLEFYSGFGCGQYEGQSDPRHVVGHGVDDAAEDPKDGV